MISTFRRQHSSKTVMKFRQLFFHNISNRMLRDLSNLLLCAAGSECWQTCNTSWRCSKLLRTCNNPSQWAVPGIFHRSSSELLAYSYRSILLLLREGHKGFSESLPPFRRGALYSLQFHVKFTRFIKIIAERIRKNVVRFV